MKSTIYASLFGITLMLALAAGGCIPQTPTPMPTPDGATPARVSLPDSELRTLQSSATGRSYDIYVGLPSDYAQRAAHQFPVLYVLDGQWDFKLLQSIYGGLLYDGFVPEMIIVGITYSGDKPDYNALRAMDYTPTQDFSLPGSGGARQFLAFLKQELIPFIETGYRTDPARRVLMGSSFGGSFTLYTLFSEPGLFSGYVAASPAVEYGQRIAFQEEADYAAGHKDLPVRLFLSVGTLEPLERPVQEFMQILDKRGYAGLELETRLIEGEQHSGNKPEAYNRGLRFIFQGK